MQDFIWSVGWLPTKEEKIKITQHHAKLSARILTHQHRACKHLGIIDKEEDNHSFSYLDNSFFTEGSDGELIL